MQTLLIMSTLVHCYVGCNTGSPDRQALHVLECNTETGAAKIVQSVKGVEGTTYFQLDKDRKFLYSVIGEKRDTQSKSAVVRFPVEADGRLGAMERLADLPCEAPCHVALSPDGKRVAFAAYLSATCGTVGVDGKGLKTYVFPDDAMGCRADRQKKAYAHQAFFTQPGGVGPEMMGVVDLGCDRIRFFDPSTMTPLPQYEIRFDSGDVPRHALFPSGSGNKTLYVLNELGSTVSSFEFSAADGSKHSNIQTFKHFRRIGKWSMLPADCTMKPTETKAAAIKLTADGKILMASNRGHDSIAFYAVDTATGRLTLRNIAPLAGKFPRDFELMPGEKFMVVGHKMSNEIRIYRFDRDACTITPVGETIPVWRPLCFKF